MKPVVSVALDAALHVLVSVVEERRKTGRRRHETEEGGSGEEVAGSISPLTN